MKARTRDTVIGLTAIVGAGLVYGGKTWWDDREAMRERLNAAELHISMLESQTHGDVERLNKALTNQPAAGQWWCPLPARANSDGLAPTPWQDSKCVQSEKTCRQSLGGSVAGCYASALPWCADFTDGTRTCFARMEQCLGFRQAFTEKVVNPKEGCSHPDGTFE